MKKTFRFILSRIAHQWSWWDTVVGFTVGVFIGVVICIFMWHTAKLAMFFITEWAGPIMHFMMGALLIGRMFAVARWPRNPPLDYTKLTLAGGFWANFLLFILGVAFLAIIFNSAPNALEGLNTLAGHLGALTK